MERRDVQRIIGLLGSYFLLQLVIRLFVSPGLELDEAEQLLLTQQLSLGYGSQPPLYTWLLSGLFALFGVNLFPLALLKNLLLFSTYLLTYKAARSLGYNRNASIAAMLSLLFIPQIAWESQRDLTHSVLAVALTAAAMVSWLRLRRAQSIVNYLLVGLCWGAGLLGKYNFGIFLVSLLFASLTIAEYRALLLRPRMLYAFGVMLAAVAPHVIWAATHVPVLMTSSGKFKQAAQKSYAASVLKGTGSLIMAVLAFAGPLIIIYVFVWFRQRNKCGVGSDNAPQDQAVPNLLLRCILFSLAICLAMVLLFQVTEFKDRWMQPIMFFLPLALLPVMGNAMAAGKARFVRLLAVAVACVVLTGLSFRAMLAPYTGSVTRFNLPYHDLVARLEPQVRGAELVVAQNGLLGGHLKLLYPSARVTVPGGARLYHDSSPKTALVVWQDDPDQKQYDGLWSLVRAIMGDCPPLMARSSLQAPFRYLPGRTMSLSFVLVERKAALAPVSR